MLIYERLFRFLKGVLSIATANSFGVLLIISILFYDNLKNVWKGITQNHVNLAIGILSGRENFDQRAAARETWLKNLTEGNNNVKSWFIVGNTACKVPPEYRLSPYGCEKWNINNSGLQEYFYTASESGARTCSTSPKRIFRQGFTFQVNYPVVITKLGIHSGLLLENIPTRIALMDIQTKDIIVQGMVSSNQSSIVNGYIYADVDTIILPKNYEGLLLVEGYLKKEECSNVVWNDGGGVITFKRIYSTMYHLDSKEHSFSHSIATSIGFFIPDIANLTKIVKDEDLIKEKWLQKLEESSKQLQKEVAEKNDIAMVDVTDTYRSLPLKLLKFYEWLNSHYSYLYVLKTDDDCIIDVTQLLKKLQEDSQFNPSKPWIWSRFRKDWPLNFVGKWADHDYKSSYYPSFPCGAAYVMSHPIVRWISSNAEHLHTYQGEDVSMGIWLSAVNPKFIEDEKFECDNRCKRESYNRAQLTPSHVREVWSNFRTCNSLCSCDGISSL